MKFIVINNIQAYVQDNLAIKLLSLLLCVRKLHDNLSAKMSFHILFETIYLENSLMTNKFQDNTTCNYFLKFCVRQPKLVQQHIMKDKWEVKNIELEKTWKYLRLISFSKP